MVEDKTKPPSDGSSADAAHGSADIPAKLRKRLEDLYKFGQDKSATGDRDYAHSMYAQCVANDPSNLKYVESMFLNLNTKWAAKKGKCRVKESRASFKKAFSDKDWKVVFKTGLDLLKDNPWDIPTLRSLAEACAANRYNEVELAYLKNALDSRPKDVDVNRHCATSLTRMGQLDQAIACWARIEDKVKSEAQKQISDLTMAKNRGAMGMDEDDEETPRAAPRQDRAAESSGSSPNNGASQSGIQRAASESAAANPQPITQGGLEQAIVERPEDLENYLALAALHTEEGRWRDAEQVLRRALPVSGASLNVQEALEKAQLNRSRAELAKLKKQASDQPGNEMEEKLSRAQRQNLRLELDVYGSRAERYPDDLRLKYEVGNRMKKIGNFEEAIPYLDQASADPKHAAAALIARGECLQQMKQYTAALKSYEEAVETTSESPPNVLHLALYRAATLAIGLKDTARAQNWLKKLLEIAPGYRDAAARLDKLG